MNEKDYKKIYFTDEVHGNVVYLEKYVVNWTLIKCFSLTENKTDKKKRVR